MILATGLAGTLHAQVPEPTLRRGVLHVTDWPATLLAEGRPLEPWAGLDLLPFLDTLALEYAYGVEAGRPAMTFTLWWVPGDEAILDGRRVPADRLPAGVRLTALDLRAGVYAGGRRVTELVVSVDSFALEPAPFVYRFDGLDLDWATLFADVPADTARWLFETGFELREPEILRIAFAEHVPPAREPEVVPRPPARTTVYIPDRTIWIVIRTGRPYPRVATGPRRPRGDTIGRTDPAPSDRTRSRPRDDADDDPDEGEKKGGHAGRDGPRGGLLDGPGNRKKDDDDDDEQLLPAALAGAAAVGLIAVAGGTAGYFGHERAPIGLASGFVRPRWGGLLQVAVNGAVLGAGDEPERLVGTLFFFFDAFDAPVQPGVGLGIWAEEDGDDIHLASTLSLGAVARLGFVLVQGGYDLVEGGVQFGLAFTFRRP
ncbi:MAG: hypothetical protein KatS3mg042_0897 [Rhodothermaceae bacterium]|nr:MAG: hypothetical protein KatS3mg042_0897 [Rhodothermaceae bacterium]